MFHHFSAVATNAGGVEMYISNKFLFETSKEYNIENADCENLWIKLQSPKSIANCVVGVTYRHPTRRQYDFVDAVNFSQTKLFISLEIST